MPGVGRFGGEDWIKGNIDKPFSLNQYGYCWGNPMVLVDRDGRKPQRIEDAPLANPSNATPRVENYPEPVGVNADMVKWYQGMTGNSKPLETGQMYYVDASVSASSWPEKTTMPVGVGGVMGKTVVFNKDKYCIYTYGGFGGGFSFGIPFADMTASLGIVNNVYEPEDFNGKFRTIYSYSIFNDGKVIAVGTSSRSGDIVMSVSEYAISKFAMSVGYSETYYTAKTEKWVKGNYFEDTGDSPYNCTINCSQTQ